MALQKHIIDMVDDYETDLKLQLIEQQKLEQIKKKLEFYKQYQRQFSDLMINIYRYQSQGKGISILSKTMQSEDLFYSLSLMHHFQKKMKKNHHQLLTLFHKYLALKQSFDGAMAQMKMRKNKKISRLKIEQKIKNCSQTHPQFLRTVEAVLKQHKNAEKEEILKALLFLEKTKNDNIITMTNPIKGAMKVSTLDEKNTLMICQPCADQFVKCPLKCRVVYIGILSGRYAVILQNAPFQLVLWGLENPFIHVGDELEIGFPLGFMLANTQVNMELFKNAENIDPYPFLATHH